MKGENTMRDIRTWVVSLGCPKNRVDTETILAGLSNPDGPGAFRIKPVPEPEGPDWGGEPPEVILINTCGFIRPAVEESVQTVLDAVNRIAGFEKKPVLAVVGCLVGRYGAGDLAAELPEVDIWATNRELAAVAPAILERLGIAAPAPGLAPVRVPSTAPGTAYLKIGEGCGRKCAFCTIPSIRGPLLSTPAEALAEEARGLLAQGVKELVLVAQDLTQWGKDLGIKAPGLPRLLDKLLPLDGLEWLRLMYLYPSGLTPELLRYLKQAGRPLLPYFDVPLQHADPDVLQAMGRAFARDPREVIDRIRAFFPEAAIRTSLIVGYPGETPARFKRLVRFVEEARLDHVGVFAFQPEEGTRAARLPDRPSPRTAEKRRAELMEVQRMISAAKLAERVGQTLEVLVEAPHPEWPGLFTGRTWFQAPEVDGTTYVSGPPDQDGAGREIRPGHIVHAEIVESHDFDLTALL